MNGTRIETTDSIMLFCRPVGPFSTQKLQPASRKEIVMCVAVEIKLN